MKIAVAGTGYVGLVTGVCLAEVGHLVTCVDIDESKIERMQAGISPIYEEGLEALLQKNLRENRLKFTTNFKEAYSDSEVIFIGVGTPERSDGSANLDYVFQVAKEIAESVQKDTIIVVKSTVPIGTNDKVESYIKNRLTHSVSIEVASNPEFLAQGTAVRDTLQASRIVVGVESENAEKVLKAVYSPFNQPILVMNRKSAEMVKYSSNDFLALKISFMNDIANLCEIVGANVEDVATGMSYDNRIGKEFLRAGIGYGGSCFPKDTKALHWLSSQYGYELKTVKAAIEVNENQKYKLYKKALEEYESLEGLTIAVLGLTFKPGTDDLREAPSIPNVRALLEQRAKINAYDPVGIKNFRKLFPEEINYTNSALEALKDADLCFIFTEWKEIKNLQPDDFVKHMKYPVVFDGRNCFNVSDMKDANIKYYSIGR
ncbi:UDP-glucose/GDP-mannose dehydrogenase family protein [Mycoplasmatota bacterium]|nr:UDP-glucose/GDP-mannose dehydrogenase family protein [Mycoplasmatota bacterium]